MDETGRVVAGRYECLEKIGRGASARVYRALDRNTHQLLAVKILAGGNSGDEHQRKQFQRELAALKKLKSPYTVRLVDAGSDEDDLYLAMEYVSGQSLQEVLQSQAPLDPQRACRLVAQLLKALEEAHHKGIIHRDLKPANMLIQLEGSGEHLRLGDFGVARMLGMTTYNAAGTGTPYYMSPEQIEGHEIGCESDLYAVGVVLYEMLVGRPPFEGDMNTVLAAHVRRSPAWPSQPKVPKRLRQVIEMAMKKKPGSRYRSAQAMREAIESWLHGASLPMKYREDSRGWWIAGMLFFGALALFANIDGTLNFFSNTQKWWQTRHKKPKQRAKPTRQAARPSKERRAASLRRQSPPKPKTRLARGLQLRGPVPWRRLLPKTPKRLAPPRPGEGRPIDKLSGARRRWIPPGRYLRGSPTSEIGREDDERQHHVRIKRGFWLWATEVTQAQYKALATLPQKSRTCPTCPVTHISWHDAARWANLLSKHQGRAPCYRCQTKSKGATCRPLHPQRYTRCKGWRLPTDAEWEYAYRAGTTTAHYEGNLAKGDAPQRSLMRIGWYKANSQERPHKVGQHKPNPWGLSDMAGNVWEWVFDRKGAYPNTTIPLQDPTGPNTGPYRIQRGGSFYDDAPWLRAAARLGLPPHKRSRFTGFRLARSNTAQP